MLLNDLLFIDPFRFETKEHCTYTKFQLSERTNHCGFMIDDNIYSIGGLGLEGPLNQFLTCNIREKP